jgi:hypothetical protein
MQELVEGFAVRQIREAVVRGQIFDALVRPVLLVGTVEILSSAKETLSARRCSNPVSSAVNAPSSLDRNINAPMDSPPRSSGKAAPDRVPAFLTA